MARLASWASWVLIIAAVIGAFILAIPACGTVVLWILLAGYAR